MEAKLKFVLITTLLFSVSSSALATKKDPLADAGGGPGSAIMDETTGPKGIIKLAGPAAENIATSAGKKSAEMSKKSADSKASKDAPKPAPSNIPVTHYNHGEGVTK